MTKELLLDRAERGEPRGAQAVWAAAHEDAATSQPGGHGKRSSSAFRLTVAAAAAVLIGVVLAQSSLRTTTDRPTAADRPDNAVEITEPAPREPAPLSVEGMRLEVVEAPEDVSSACDEPIEEDAVGLCRERSFAVYADPEQPLAGSVVIIEILPDDGFELLGVNLDQSQLDAFADDVVRAEINGSETWILESSADLEEMARFDDAASVQTIAGWTYEFHGRGSQGVVVQTELDADSAGIWRWVARTADATAATRSLEPIGVFGTDGARIASSDPGDVDVVWTSGERIYRMWAFENPRFGDWTSISVDPFVDRLQPAERAEWLAAIDDASNTTLAEWISDRLLGIAVLALAVISVFSVWQRRWVLAVLTAVAPVIWYGLVVGWPVTIAMLAAWVAIADDRRRKGRRPTPPPPPPASQGVV